VVAPHNTSSGFETDFENFFSANSVPAVEGDPASKDEEWADVDETGEAQSIRLKELGSAPDVLPTVETLARPDILFRSLTPYLLNVTLQSANKLVVQGTHEPSLQLLSDYLQRWMKRDHRDIRKVSGPPLPPPSLFSHWWFPLLSKAIYPSTPQHVYLAITVTNLSRHSRTITQIPLLRATLGESNFGLGLSYDTLTIEPHDHHQRYVEINPTIVLVFIEGVLGYHLAHTKGDSWEFRREVAFK
jgi:hypothetical protein